ncbi:MAG: 50S ribosomal protein L10 [Alphaproteobacteria bacterium RIFOXYD12_FULL_60_8]|nr:MAG: 50S ribosomal protein L10 [Alphaproteobacteria bacterium RIFOXYD12_FULL_60_8]
MNREEKKDLVASLNAVFAKTTLVVVVHYKGMTVGQVETVRKQMRTAGASFKVTKNRLTRLALKGTNYEGLNDMFTGPTAIAYSDDPVAAAKVVVDYAKGNDKLVILGGSLGTQVLDVNGVKALASLPSLDELRARLLGMIQTPATRIAGILQAPGGQIARVIGAHARKDEAA